MEEKVTEHTECEVCAEQKLIVLWSFTLQKAICNTCSLHIESQWKNERERIMQL